MLINQFQSFYHHHFPDNMETFIDYFSVFGGLEWDFDIYTPIEQLIKEMVFDHYSHLYHHICTMMTLDDPVYHKLLSAIAIGDRRIHSACKRAHISEEKGLRAIEFFRQNGILSIEYSRESPPKKLYPKQRLKREVSRHRISHKIRFNSPFLRFWFYFIAPMYRHIEEGNYHFVEKRFREQHSNFSSFTFEDLSLLLLEKKYDRNRLVSIGSYWDRKVELDILAYRKSGEIIVGECKWTNTKINKSELSKLQEKCKTIQLEPDMIMLFSKRGFSKELINQRNEQLQLFSAEDFSLLLDNEILEEKIRSGIPLP